MNEQTLWALLARAPGLTNVHVRAAREELGQLERLADPQSASRCGALPERARLFLSAPDHGLVESDLRWLSRTGARLIDCTSAHYPPLLSGSAGAPAVLYALGELDALAVPQLAMVGARSATPGGRATAREFAQSFARHGLAVTSGLALGIDAASHEGALAGGGLTIAVCGHGLDRVYPAENRDLAERIRRQGVLLSALPPGTPPRRELFPQRNRIISGLALGTLVVEAAPRSGSLITAGYAKQSGRKVFAIPGSIRSPLSRGCHQLIRDGARLVETPEEVRTSLEIPSQQQALAFDEIRMPERAAAARPLDKGYEMLLDAVGFEPVSVNTLVERTGLPSGSVTSMLLILELGGRIAPHPGGRYCRLS